MHQYTIITSYEEKCAPPEQEVLKVSVVGNAAFLTIGQHEETNKTVAFSETAHITVPLDTLWNTLRTAVVSENAREAEKAAGLVL